MTLNCFSHIIFDLLVLFLQFGHFSHFEKFFCLRSALFWDITLLIVEISYLRFGTTYLFHIHWSRRAKFPDNWKPL